MRFEHVRKLVIAAGTVVTTVAAAFGFEIPADTMDAITAGVLALVGLILMYRVPQTPVDPSTKSSTLRSPAPVGIVALLFAMLALSGCGALSTIERPEIDSIAKGIAVTAADLETAAQTTERLCGHTEPGGPCARGAPISTSTKASIAARIQEGIDALNTANAALAIDDTFEADDQLLRAESILAIIEAELANHEN